MKKFTKILTVIMAAGMVGAAGCSVQIPSVSVKANWYTNTSYEGIQNAGTETLRYKISYTSENEQIKFGEDSNYVTTFSTSTLGTALTGSPYTYAASATTGVYKWEAKQEIYVTAGSRTFTDTIQDVVYFRSIGDTLAPVYSRRDVNTHNIFTVDAEANVQSYVTYYNENMSKATVVLSDGTTSEQSISANYPVFDNAQLFIALRGVTYTNSYSAMASVFVPADNGVTNVRVIVRETGVIGANDENKLDAAAFAALSAYYPTLKVEGTKFGYNAVSIQKDGIFAGQAQHVWYASIPSSTANTYQTIPFRYAVGAPYNVGGSMEYTLCEVVSTFNK